MLGEHVFKNFALKCNISSQELVKVNVSVCRMANQKTPRDKSVEKPYIHLMVKNGLKQSMLESAEFEKDESSSHWK